MFAIGPRMARSDSAIPWAAWMRFGEIRVGERRLAERLEVFASSQNLLRPRLVLHAAVSDQQRDLRRVAVGQGEEAVQTALECGLQRLARYRGCR
jgi:hypothetical protein